MTPIPVVCIMNVGHSGSTLLGLLLGAHSRVLSAGEFSTITRPETKISNGETPAIDDVWQKPFEICSRQEFELRQSLRDYWRTDQWLRYRKTGALVDKSALRDRYYQAISSALQTTNRSVFVLASTHAEAEVVLLAGDPRYSVMVIRLERDSRGVIYSYFKKRGRVWRQARHWLLGNLKICYVIRRYRLRSISVSYESLASQPSLTLEQISSFLGLSYEEAMLDFRSVPQRLIGGNRMRFSDSITITADTSWRTELSGVGQAVGLLVTGVYTMVSWLRYLVPATSLIQYDRQYGIACARNNNSE